MRIDIITVCPELVLPFTEESIVGRGQKKGLVEIQVHNLRDYSTNRWRRVDDYPFGGGAGMVMQPEPIARAIEVSLDLLYFGDSTKVLFESVPNEGRLIVNAIYYLWKNGVITYWENGNEYYSMGSTGRKYPYQLMIQKYSYEIRNLVKNLDEFESRKKSYPNPDEYLDMILESFANEINEKGKS